MEQITEEIIELNHEKYMVRELLGHGKGGYSYLVEADEKLFVLKQIHHEPCNYYTFGDKIEAEKNDYELLLMAGIAIPKMLDIDVENERILKEYIKGPTIYELIKDNQMKEEYLEQVKYMSEVVKGVGLNIDYFPTNFVVQNNKVFYIDYECNQYTEEWNFENWGIKYWSRTAEFLEYVREHSQ